MDRSVASVIAGNEVTGAPGGRLRSVNPARTGEVVAEVTLGLDARFGRRFEEYLSWIRPHHRLLGSTGTGRITAGSR